MYTNLFGANIFNAKMFSLLLVLYVVAVTDAFYIPLMRPDPLYHSPLYWDLEHSNSYLYPETYLGHYPYVSYARPTVSYLPTPRYPYWYYPRNTRASTIPYPIAATGPINPLLSRGYMEQDPVTLKYTADSVALRPTSSSMLYPPRHQESIGHHQVSQIANPGQEGIGGGYTSSAFYENAPTVVVPGTSGINSVASTSLQQTSNHEVSESIKMSPNSKSMDQNYRVIKSMIEGTSYRNGEPKH